jgi:hypothetical protein
MADAPRHFTREEVDRLIPRLGAIMSRVKTAHAEGARLRGLLQDDQRQVVLAGGMRLSPERWRARRLAIERASVVVQRGLGEVVALGGEPKDLDLGLVDFRGWLEGREVNLCWRLGEERLGFWHALDEGFARRKPLP